MMGLSIRDCRDRTRRLRLNVRKKIIYSKGSEAPAVGAPSLEVLRASLDETLGSLCWWRGSQPTAGSLELDRL